VLGALALLLVARWWVAPRANALSGAGFDPEVGAFLLQAPAFPVGMVLAEVGVQPRNPLGSSALPAIPLALLYGGTWLALSLYLAATGRARLAVAGSLWVAMALLPPWISLSRDYALIAPRLAHPASLGIAAAWAAVLGDVGGRAVEWLCRPGQPVFGRVAGFVSLLLAAALAAGVVRASVGVVQRQNAMYAAGARALADLTAAIAATPRGATVGVVNFPDRFALRAAPFPLGRWALTLAPADTPLAEFVRAAHGVSRAVVTRAVPARGQRERATWPYQVDMLGIPVDGSALAEAFPGAGPVLTTDYDTEGTVALRTVGGRRVSAGDAPSGVAAGHAGSRLGALPSTPRQTHARFGNIARLTSSAVLRTAAGVRVELVWQLLDGAAPNDTVFVHVFNSRNELLLTGDGDPWSGLTPLAAFEAHAVIEDPRVLEVPTALSPGLYTVTAGIYNRVSGNRPVPTGTAPLDRNGEVVVGRFAQPYTARSRGGPSRGAAEASVTADITGALGPAPLVPGALPAGLVDHHGAAH
jgi:hypothetical protein